MSFFSSIFAKRTTTPAAPETIKTTDEGSCEKAAKILCDGGVVVIPTDTVYGLAAHPAHPEAVERLYSIKHRDSSKPIALLASSVDAVAAFGFPLKDEAKALAEAHWPGALTIVATNTSLKTEGFRVPDHEWARRLIEMCGGVLRVTSANTSGKAPATDAAAAAQDIGGGCDLVVDGGTSPGGVASTVVKAVPGLPLVVLREGTIKVEAPKKAEAPAKEKSVMRMSGRFFVTLVATGNKALFGAIAGQECFLNELGHELNNVWRGIKETHQEAAFYDHVVMPNHFHAALRIFFRDDNHEDHLAFILDEFKAKTLAVYTRLKEEGRIQDAGDDLWRGCDLSVAISSEREMQTVRDYIRSNAKTWTTDRYGECTLYSFGNLALLDEKKVAFVASAAFPATPFRPRKIKGNAAQTQSPDAPCISTFTSRQEREMLRRILAKGRKLIQVLPDGIPPENGMNPALAAACHAGNALMISPRPAGSTMNKRVANACNEYVIANAAEIWAGDISPGGTLATLLDQRA